MRRLGGLIDVAAFSEDPRVIAGQAVEFLEQPSRAFQVGEEPEVVSEHDYRIELAQLTADPGYGHDLRLLEST